MSWTNIPNANLAIGAPIRSIDQLALRDNPIAIAEGATGAPRVRAEALNGGQSGSAPIYAARAWVNFDGTGTVAIRASGNVSSITDNGVGLYTVNFTTAMPDADYTLTGSAGGVGGSNSFGGIAFGYPSAGSPVYTSSQCTISTFIAGTGASDRPYVTLAVFR
jgi:hypothetical protein